MNKEILKVAIQGIAGSFHDQAAREFFNRKEIHLNGCSTFEQLFDSVDKHESDVAVMAIENTVAGSLLPNYALMNASGFVIFGEVFLRISQHLIALPGQLLSDIKEVHSHYMAIAQTRDFFKSYPALHLIEADDTAGSARWVASEKLKGVAAIAGRNAAEMYGLDILAEAIETNKRNYTRFLFLYKPNGTERFSVKNPDKASLSFSLPHHTGSLSQVLSIFSFYGINLTKIQSIPIIGEEFQYHFLVDLTYGDLERYRQSVDAIRPLTRELTILGEYKQGKLVE